ncbi:hypothetical protein HWV62_38332 [Athelia sp. TMB]|nr:hypothetical protein HWV62_38332 [Athelia sp. TMB]
MGTADVPQGWRSVQAARAVPAEQDYGSLRLRGYHTSWPVLMTRGNQVSLEWVGRFTVNSVEAILATLAGGPCRQLGMAAKATPGPQRWRSEWAKTMPSKLPRGVIDELKVVQGEVKVLIEKCRKDVSRNLYS